MMYLGDYFFSEILPKEFSKLWMEFKNKPPQTDPENFFLAYSLCAQELGNRFWEPPDPALKEDAVDFSAFVVPIQQYFVPAWGKTICLPGYKFQPQVQVNGNQISKVVKLLEPFEGHNPLLTKLALDPRFIHLNELSIEQRCSFIKNRKKKEFSREEKFISKLVQNSIFTPAQLEEIILSFPKPLSELFLRSETTNKVLVQRSEFFVDKIPEWGILIQNRQHQNPFVGYIGIPEFQKVGNLKFKAQIYVLNVHEDSLLFQQDCSSPEEVSNFLMEKLETFNEEQNLKLIQSVLPKIMNAFPQSKEKPQLLNYNNFFKSFWNYKLNQKEKTKEETFEDFLMLFCGSILTENSDNQETAS